MENRITSSLMGQIPVNALPEQEQLQRSESWQIALSRALTNPIQLLEYLQLDSALLNPDMIEAHKQFKLFVTESFLKRIQPGNPDDPLLKQIMPLANELQINESFSLDPLQELLSNPTPGLLHKYQGRALLITNAHCAINCRFCFRRNFPYQNNHFSSSNSDNIFNVINTDPSIEELILSGGDPLLLNDKRLTDIISLAENIPHLKRLRVHTRIPIVLPERITDSLIKLITNCKLTMILVVHCNHAQEINEEVEQAIHKLKPFCILYNQSVLLKGINDEIDTQVELQTRLFNLGIQPYYLHLLDKVHGTAHFDLTLEHAKTIYQGMAERLPGYMLPKLVQEIAGEKSKVQINLEAHN